LSINLNKMTYVPPTHPAKLGRESPRQLMRCRAWIAVRRVT
jgi:hypothetical protein